ncbi:MAG: hypothetical protein RL385_5578 [Pseudomonadota bacterium]|jgi:hypothetical protein
MGTAIRDFGRHHCARGKARGCGKCARAGVLRNKCAMEPGPSVFNVSARCPTTRSQASQRETLAFLEPPCRPGPKGKCGWTGEKTTGVRATRGGQGVAPRARAAQARLLHIVA